VPVDDIGRFVLASDLDGTLIDHDFRSDEVDPKLAEFARLLEGVGERLTLWFNSSRPVASQRASLELVRGLPTPAYHIGAMGTQVADADGTIITAYGDEQFGDWPREMVEKICVEQFALVPHAADMQTRYKASFDLPEPTMAAAIEGELQAAGVPAKLVVSSGRDLDVLPPAAGKAAAIRWLCGHVGVPGEAVLVSGDSLNDLDMFDPPFRGIVVGNGHDELKRLAPGKGGDVYLATGSVSAGVVEGLRHFGVLPR
jgi:sucrose-6F-phosphate phosphohydrolase